MPLPVETFSIRDDENWSNDLDTFRIRQYMEQAIEHVAGTGVGLTIDTPIYWCGLLFSYPWSDVDPMPDEDTVVAEVLKRARLTVVEGTPDVADARLALSYRGTPWARTLRTIAKKEAEDEARYSAVRPANPLPIDLTFGQNCTAELHNIARRVFADAIASMGGEIAS
jgi:hypothetical protein